MSQDKKNTGQRGEQAEGVMENILLQWQRERPDIDPAPMAVCGDIWRTSEKLKQGVLANLSGSSLDFPAFDVILTLRRQGRGKTLSPSELAKDRMLSTSAMTNRLDRLEKRGLIERQVDPNDRRGLRVILSEEGFDLADALVVSHVKTEEAMLAALTIEERDQLRALLGKINNQTLK